MTRLAVALLAAGLLLTGCAEAQDAVEEGISRATELAQNARYCVQAARVAQAVESRDVDAAVSAGEDLVAVAPEEILEEAQTILDAAKAAQAGDPSAMETQEVQAAAQTLANYTRDTCDPTN
jgi:aspartokinase